MSYTTNLIRLLLGKRFPFKFIYRNDYWMLDIGRHVFPIKKYRLIYEELLALGAKKENFLAPELASDEDVLLVHAQKYLKKLKTGTLSPAEVSALELPVSAGLPSPKSHS